MKVMLVYGGVDVELHSPNLGTKSEVSGQLHPSAALPLLKAVTLILAVLSEIFKL
jgi:hypothetical protein